MKNWIVKSSLPIVLIVAFFSLSGFTFAPTGSEAIVKIDGKIVEPEGTIKLERDDTIYLEIEGIKPNSMVDIKVKKMGVSWMKDEYEVDESGGVKAILNVPEKKVTVQCFVKYFTVDGVEKEVKFKFKVV